MIVFGGEFWFGLGHEKAAFPEECGFLLKIRLSLCLGLFDQTCLDGFDADPEALHLTGGEAYFNALQVGAELAFRRFRYVHTNAAAFLALTLAVDDAACGRTLACDCANSCHVEN